MQPNLLKKFNVFYHSLGYEVTENKDTLRYIARNKKEIPVG